MSRVAHFLTAGTAGACIVTLAIVGPAARSEAPTRNVSLTRTPNPSPISLQHPGTTSTPGTRDRRPDSTRAGGTPTTQPTTTAQPVPDLGAGASLNGRRPFPPSNAWNRRITNDTVDPNSAALIASIGLTGHLHPDFGADLDGRPFGIPYVVVNGSQHKVPVSFDYADESDPGPYPIPPTAPIEGGAAGDGDRHVLAIDRDTWQLYELYAAYPKNGGTSWTAGSGAVFHLTTGAPRRAGWTSADAAGLPVFPGLVRYDEVSAGQINHALRFTVARTRHGYVAPARHFASGKPSANLPPMGMRVRLKASFPIAGYPKAARVILYALKNYGMIVADNGSNWFVSGAPDKRWDDGALNTLKRVPGSAFEVVTMGKVTTS